MAGPSLMTKLMVVPVSTDVPSADALLNDRAVGLVGRAGCHLADDKARLRGLLADDLNVDADEGEHRYRLRLLPLADNERDSVAYVERFAVFGDRADNIALCDAAVFLDRVAYDEVEIEIRELERRVTVLPIDKIRHFSVFAPELTNTEIVRLPSRSFPFSGDCSMICPSAYLLLAR